MTRARKLQVSADSKILDTMVDAGVASTRSEAMRMVVAHRGRPTGYLKEAGLLQALQRVAAASPLSDESIRDGIRRARGARLP